MKEPELNRMVVRKVYDSTPVAVEYGLSESGIQLLKFWIKLLDGGIENVQTYKINELKSLTYIYLEKFTIV